MKLIHKHEICWVFSLPAIGKYKIELVYCPPNYAIKPHSHNNQDIKLIYLFGHNTRLFRCESDGTKLVSFLARIRFTGKVFTIRAGNIHWFTVSRWPFIFLNCERWKCKPSSATIDFQLTTEKEEFNYGRQTTKN